MITLDLKYQASREPFDQTVGPEDIKYGDIVRGGVVTLLELHHVTLVPAEQSVYEAGHGWFWALYWSQ